MASGVLQQIENRWKNNLISGFVMSNTTYHLQLDLSMGSTCLVGYGILLGAAALE